MSSDTRSPALRGINARVAFAFVAAHRAFADTLEAELAEANDDPPEVPQAEPILLRKNEIAVQLRVSSATIDRYVLAGMPYKPFGAAKRFDLEACLAWTTSRPVKSKRTDPIFASVRLLKRK